MHRLLAVCVADMARRSASQVKIIHLALTGDGGLEGGFRGSVFAATP